LAFFESPRADTQTETRPEQKESHEGCHAEEYPRSTRTWRGRTDGWIFRARARDALNLSGAVAIPRRAGTALSAFSGYGTRPVEAISR
jgi:hypothetical protein